MSDRIRMTIDAAFRHGDIVKHKADDEEQSGIVTAIIIRPGDVFYRVAWGHDEETDCFELELSHAHAQAEP